MGDQAARPQEFTVEPGDNMDVCPNCGIWRMNAGYVRESCGESFRAPGCFVAAATAEPAKDPA